MPDDSEINNLKTRPVIEIIKAHDILDAILHDDLPLNMTKHQKEDFTQMKVLLCWVLQHDGQRWFADNLARLQKELEKYGYELKALQ